MSEDRDKNKFNLRLADGMRDRLREAAELNNRSMNAEIVYRLQTTLEMDDYAPGDNVNHDALPAGDERFLERIREIIAEEMGRKG